MQWSDGIHQSVPHGMVWAGCNGIGRRQWTRRPHTAAELAHHLEDVVGKGCHVSFAIDFPQPVQGSEGPFRDGLASDPLAAIFAGPVPFPGQQCHRVVPGQRHMSALRSGRKEIVPDRTHLAVFPPRCVQVALLLLVEPVVPRQLYLPVGVNQFCRFTSSAWTRCWAVLGRRRNVGSAGRAAWRVQFS